MSNEPSRSCECGGAMAPIEVIDKHAGMTRLSQAGPLEYRLPGERPSFWTGRFPSGGILRAFMCGECGRVSFYGVPAGA